MIILIGIIFLCILLIVGEALYKTGVKTAERKLFPQLFEKEKCLWSKQIKLPGFKIFIYRIKITKAEKK